MFARHLLEVVFGRAPWDDSPGSCSADCHFFPGVVVTEDASLVAVRFLQDRRAFTGRGYHQG